MRKIHGADDAGNKRRRVESLISFLPTDVLQLILIAALKNGHKSLCMFRLVCRTWCEFVVTENVFWKHLVNRGFAARGDFVQTPVQCVDRFSDYYKQRMMCYRVGRSYLRFQGHLSSGIRASTVNWMLKMVDRSASTGTLLWTRLLAAHRCVAFFDRFCNYALNTVNFRNIQQVAAGCVLLALEMRSPNSIEKSAYASFERFTSKCTGADIKQVTLNMFKALSKSGNAPRKMWKHTMFRIEGCTKGNNMRLLPSSKKFGPTCEEDTQCFFVVMKCLRFVHKDNHRSSMFWTCMYLCEIALQSDVFLIYTGNIIGFAIYALGCHIMRWTNARVWTGILPHTNAALIYECIGDLFKLLEQTHAIRGNYEAEKKRGNKKILLHYLMLKFSTPYYRKAALMPLPKYLPPKWTRLADVE